MVRAPACEVGCFDCAAEDAALSAHRFAQHDNDSFLAEEADSGGEGAALAGGEGGERDG